MYEDFASWLESVLEMEFPDSTVALYFNIYEEGDDTWSVQLIATDRFDPDDSDWACEEIFSTEDDLYTFNRSEDSEYVSEEVCEWVAQYLDMGDKADILKEYEAVGAGIAEGDVNVLYQR